MGFYNPATIIEDAKRHGIEMRPASVVASDWDCTLEDTGRARFAVRIGLRYVKSLGAGDYEKIDSARHAAPFVSVEDLSRRTGLDQRALSVLAESGAMETLTPHRREALWKSLGTARGGRAPLALPDRERKPAFASLTAFETVAWDYRAQAHSTRAHPLSTIRRELRALGFPTAKEVAARSNGRRVKYAGLVICRQRPATAGGTVFMTLEDETGFVNLIVWPSVYGKYVTVIKTAPILAVSGELQVEGEVVHLVAQRLWPPEVDVADAHAPSRDFH
jgi:error-prone DNA polymerase